MTNAYQHYAKQLILTRLFVKESSWNQPCSLETSLQLKNNLTLSFFGGRFEKKKKKNRFWSEILKLWKSMPSLFLIQIFICQVFQIFQNGRHDVRFSSNSLKLKRTPLDLGETIFGKFHQNRPSSFAKRLWTDRQTDTHTHTDRHTHRQPRYFSPKRSQYI